MSNTNTTSKNSSGSYISGVKENTDKAFGKPTGFLQSELVADAIAAVLICTGVCMSAFFFTVYETAFFSNFIFTCVSVLLLVLFSKRWWLGPVTLGTALLAVFIYFYISGTLAENVQYCREFIQWAFGKGNYLDIYSTNGSVIMLWFATVFFISLLVFLLIRKLFFFPLVLGLLSVFFVVVYILARIELSVPICISAAGVIMLVPRFYSKYVKKHSSGSGESRALMQMLALPVAVVVVVSAMVVVPQDASVWRSKWINDLIYDINILINGPFKHWPSAASNFTLYSMGFQSEYGRLGGPVKLTEKDVMYIYNLEQPLLLRGSTADFYDGENWLIGGYDGDFRYKRLFWRAYKNEAFNIDKPYGGMEVKRLYQSLTTELRFEETYINPGFTSIFAGGRLRDIGFQSSRLDSEIFFNIRSEIYMHSRVPANQRISIRTRVWNTSLPNFEQEFLRLEALVQNADDEQYDLILPRYTQLYDNLPQSLIDTAEQITEGIDSPYLKAKAIKQWLSENFEYMLEPVIPPEDEDFVAHFLETKQGYCSYYASAMAVLARCAGLPSRFVTGFALEEGREGVYKATGKTAHAWAEIYFKGIGWVEFDPLDWDASVPLNNIEQEEIPEPAVETAKTEIPESEEPEYEIPEYQEVELSVDTAYPSDSGTTIKAVALFIGAVLLLLAIRLLIKFVLNYNFYYFEINRVIRRKGSLYEAMEYYHKDIAKQLLHLGVDLRAGETLHVFSARVDKRIIIADISFGEVAESLMLMYFAGVKPTRKAVEKAWVYHTWLEKRIMEQNGKTKYLLLRGFARWR